MTESQPALELTGIHRAWRQKPVLQGVDLELRPGSAAAIAGANGAGKTTLLRVACGLVGPDAGRVRLHGLDPWRDRRAFQARLGVLAAGDRGLYARLTTAQTIKLGAGLALLPRRRREELIAATRERFLLDELWSTRVDRLSLGQRQRLRLALTFLHAPDVVVLDEPHTSLDDAGLEIVTGAIRDQVAGGGSVLWCAPAPERIGLPYERLLVLEAGRLRTT